MKEKNNKIFASLALVTLTAGILYPTVTANTFNPGKGENIETQVEYKADLQDLQINTIMGLGEEEFLDDEFGGFDDTSTSNELSLIGSIKIYKIAEDESMIQLRNTPQVELVDEIGNVVAQTDIYNMEDMPELYYLTFENLQVEKNKEYSIRVTIDDNGKTISKNATFNYLYEGELEYVSPGVSCSMNVNAAQNVTILSFVGELGNVNKEDPERIELDIGWSFEPFYISKNEKAFNEELTEQELIYKAEQLAKDKVNEYLSNPDASLPTCYISKQPKIEDNTITFSIAFETNSAGPQLGTVLYTNEYKIPVIAVETLALDSEINIDYPENITENADKEEIIFEYFETLINNTNLVYRTNNLYNDYIRNAIILSEHPIYIENDKCDFMVSFSSKDMVNDNTSSSMLKYKVTLNPVKYLKGDMDKNGIINGTDASMALDIYNKNIATTENLVIGDMDNNGIINGTDAAMILDIYNKVL